MQFELNRDARGKVPFGAQAYDESGKLLGMVDSQSWWLVFGIEDHGCIDMRSGNQSSALNYGLAERNKELAYERVVTHCTRPVVRTP